jgi:ech hydrogenase subunit F
LEREAAKCTFCGICAAKCPSQCIRVKKATATWIHDPTACVFCGTCVEVCPENCLHHLGRPRAPFTKKDAASPEAVKT